ncbi:uncharacterized protein PRCAT00005440001 [Priceomyces carsonii]|uniref:uncharacterized protein n=1 Tax=Priceomyces carsonii TaxID=28549 RepID=UPI002EDAA5FB|nr:unnamed protein product [Priceomyces carsonii]
MSDLSNQRRHWDTKRAYRSWLLLCFSTGPVASMVRTYVPAAIQSVAVAIGRGSEGEKCSNRGNNCFVSFGTSRIHISAYVLYLKAISTSMEGIISILLMGIADYSNYRKTFLVISIFFYGALALPFAFLFRKNTGTLKVLSALYILLNTDGAIYQILEGSYIPLFMRCSKTQDEREALQDNGLLMLKKGSKISVTGLLLGNCGGVIALLIGIIISHTRGGPIENMYYDFLSAISISGSFTLLFAAISTFYLPSIKGETPPENEVLLCLSIKRFCSQIKSIQKYPHAFLYCVSWVAWNISFSIFMSVFILLFRSTLGLGSSDSEYTVYTFTSYISASLGPLIWMALYRKLHISIKTWGYIFLTISLSTNLWGCFGLIPGFSFGFKQRWEFWFFEILYSSSSSSMRSLNRTAYSSLLPLGNEAQFFGLEVFLGVATGWVGSLASAAIQNKMGDERSSFLLSLLLVLIALILYSICDIEKGMKDVNKK